LSDRDLQIGEIKNRFMPADYDLKIAEKILIQEKIMATTESSGVNGSTSAATLQYGAQTRPTKAKDIAQFGVATIDKNASVYQAVAIMVKRSVSGLPVVDASGLLGIISEKDVLKLLFDTEFVAGCVGDYMTTGVLTFDEETDQADICKCMIEKNFSKV